MKWVCSYRCGSIHRCYLSVVLILGGVFLFATTSSTSSEGEAAQEITSSFEITGVVTIRVDNPLGEIRVRGTGADGKVEMTATEHAYGGTTSEADSRLQLFRFEPAQLGNRITVRPQLPPQEKDRTGSSDKVDILITVPRNTDLELTTELGAIQITGVQGNMLVDSKLGDTTIESSEGKLHLNADLGAVTIEDTTLASDSVVYANLGDLFFNGRFAGAGSYSFTANNGSAKIMLPQDSAFNLDAQTGNGGIKSDFAIPAGADVNTLTGSVGSNPQANLIIRGGNAGIEVLKQQ